MRTDFVSPQGLPNLEGITPGPVAPTQTQPAPANPGKIPGKVADISPRSKSLWISGGLYAAGGVVGGLAKVGLRHWLPNYASAASPLINVTTQIAMSPGQQVLQLVTNPLSVWAYTWVMGGGGQASDPGQARVMNPVIQTELAQVYSGRSRIDSWVSAPLSDFATYLQSTEQPSYRARKRLDANDVAGAARLMGAALRFDRACWPQHNPDAAFSYEKLFTVLRPYFDGLAPEQVAELKKQVVAEATRLDGGKDAGLAKYCETMIDGMTTRQPPKALQEPWGDAAGALAISDHAEKGADVWAKELINDALEKQLKNVGWLEQRKIKRDFNSALKSVVKEVQEFEQATGRLATSDELWRMMAGAMTADNGKRAELKAALISVGVFALLAGGSTFGYAKLAATLPEWIAPGVGTVVPTIIGYLTITARFGLEKFIAFGRALGWSGSAPATLGKQLDRDFRNMRVKTATIDRRAVSWYGLFSAFSRRLQKTSAAAADAMTKGNVDQAAAFLAGEIILSHQTTYYYWPFTKLMQTTFDRIGPNFDGITAAQRDELMTKTMASMKASGVSDELAATFHKPFLEGWLTRNVAVKA